MAGRKPKPTAVKKLEGNPGKRKLNTKEPVPAKGMPACPDWLMPEAKKEWERLAKLMNQMGVLTEVDMAAFAAYCQSYARWKEAQEHIWEKQGHLLATEGNVIHYDFIEKFICDLGEKYHILEITVDRWNAAQMIQNLEGAGFTMVPFGQGFASMSTPTKEFSEEKAVMQKVQFV